MNETGSNHLYDMRNQNGQNQAKESEPVQGPKIHDFFKLSPEQTSRLEDRVEAATGTVIVAVHPFYDRFSGNIAHPHKQRANERIQRVLSRLIDRDAEGRPPILLMEEIDRVDAARSLIANSNNTGEVYIVPTVTDHGIPIKDSSQDIPNHLWGSYEFLRREQQYWDNFLDILIQLGTKKAIVGGANLKVKGRMDPLQKIHHADFLRQRIKDGAANTEYQVTACVGTTLVQLARRLNVELSIFTAPYNNADIKRIENEGPSAFENHADSIIDELVGSIERLSPTELNSMREVIIRVNYDLKNIAENMSDDVEVQNLWMQYFNVKMLGKIAANTGRYEREFREEMACLVDEVIDLRDSIDSQFWTQQIDKIAGLLYR